MAARLLFIVFLFTIMTAGIMALLRVEGDDVGGPCLILHLVFSMLSLTRSLFVLHFQLVLSIDENMPIKVHRAGGNL